MSDYEERRKPRRRLLHRELENLKRELLSMGNEIEANLTKALRALEERNESSATEVIQADASVNRFEVYLEEECLKILALHQPFAVDLRLVISVLKINTDLERIDDLAVNIAERAQSLSRLPALELPNDFVRMSERTRSMVTESLESFVHMDPRMARVVCAADREVDTAHSNMYGRVEKEMKAHPERIEALTLLLSASRDLERVADHATNIAEDVLYLVEGEIVRHESDRPRARMSVQA